MQIIKRNGNAVDFDSDKIINAIRNAYVDTYFIEDNSVPEYAYNIADSVEAIAKEFDRPLTVEEIQEIVEDELTDFDKLVAKAYIRYRYKRNMARSYSENFINELGKKLAAKNIENQNANVDEHSFGGRRGEAMNLLMKQYALDFLISPKFAQNHLNNRVYIHDLDAYAVGMHNCLTIPFDDLLANGFNTRQTDVRPANSINTAFQLIAVLFQLQSLQQFGGVSASHLDWTMVPYVRKSFYKHFNDGLKYVSHSIQENWDHPEEVSIDSADYKVWPAAYGYAVDMTERELKQAVEGMFHNLNTLQSRSGNQLEVNVAG